MTTEFTKIWLKEPKNKRIVAEAQCTAKEMMAMDKSPPHPYFFFQELSWNLIYSTLTLKEQGWTDEGVEQYLAGDAIFSLNGISLFLVGAVNEALLVMPDGPVKQEIVLCKLLR